MRWQLQLLRDAVKGALPFQPAFRQLRRAISGYAPDVGNLNATLENAFAMVRLLRATGHEVADRTVLEIGTGWFPVIPILYALLGARRVILSDVHRYMDDHTFRAARDFVRQNADIVAEGLQIEPTQVLGSLVRANVPADLGFDYQVPFDTRRHPAGSVDLVTSRTVLEHIPADVLAELLPEWTRLLSGGGIMVHAIDMSDHFEHNDKTISRINFLRFGEGRWRLINSLSNDHQNRLRHSAFLALFAGAGLDVLAMETQVDDRTREDALRLNLASPFDRMSADDLAILTSYVVLGSAPIANAG